ncbi:MAG TPA: triose-phosphate isomerase [Casimicrobiaceae bacterium]|nr:triose-phosphate isomerase [Casimicrobiaceae bacterium]
MSNRLVVGNWKMNGGLAFNARLLDELIRGWKEDASRELAVCVPFPYLAQAQAALTGSPIAWGAQNVNAATSGAYTGEVATAMLMDFACRYVIVGHSERRQIYRESDEDIAAKAQACLDAGLTPIVCVGETLEEREAGSTESVVLRQLDAVLARVGERAADMVVAYEPVWAIGTGKTARPEQAQEVHARLRARLREAGAGSIAILYGGSVKADNAATLFSEQDIDGGLIGSASLKAGEFLAIAAA